MSSEPARLINVTDLYQLMFNLKLAERTIANWTRDENGYVTVHTDVIAKAVTAALLTATKMLGE